MAGSQAGAQWPGPERVPRDLALRGVPTPLHHTQNSSLTSQILSPLKFPLFLFFCLFLCFPGPSSPCALSAEVRSAALILSLVSPVCPSLGQVAPRFQDDGDPQLLGCVEGLPAG